MGRRDDGGRGRGVTCWVWDGPPYPARARPLGRRGQLTQILRGLGGLSPNERRAVGAAANNLRNLLEVKLERKLVKLQSSRDLEKLKKLEEIDTTRIVRVGDGFVEVNGKCLSRDEILRVDIYLA